MSDAKTEKRTSSADIKKQIDEATKAQQEAKDMKESGLPLVGSIASQASNISTPEPTVTTESKPEPGKPTAEEKTTPEVDLQDWAKKRGINWTTDESVLSALRKSDQEFHKKRSEDKAREIPPYQPPVYQQPPPISYPPPNGYPSNPDQRLVAEVARDYQMTIEDADRLLRFNSAFFNAVMRTERERSQKEIEGIKRDNEKNNVFRELSSDPVFKRQDVGEEFYRVMEQMQSQDPQSFEQNPAKYREAYDRALSNIGRRYLEGKPIQEGVQPALNGIKTNSLPTTPPRSIGKASGGGAEEKEFDQNAFYALKTPEEKRAYLERMGLVAGY